MCDKKCCQNCPITKFINAKKAEIPVEQMEEMKKKLIEKTQQHKGQIKFCLSMFKQNYISLGIHFAVAILLNIMAFKLPNKPVFNVLAIALFGQIVCFLRNTVLKSLIEKTADAQQYEECYLKAMECASYMHLMMKNCCSAKNGESKCCGEKCPVLRCCGGEFNLKKSVKKMLCTLVALVVTCIIPVKCVLLLATIAFFAFALYINLSQNEKFVSEVKKVTTELKKKVTELKEQKTIEKKETPKAVEQIEQPAEVKPVEKVEEPKAEEPVEEKPKVEENVVVPTEEEKKEE
ncbi:Hypothetical_protein [Hexamita inflata]|uniref:Hypothetical_protein n=1 Tax=Hexamita inflata TaxID=28002 RepID=A0ABP1IKS6_9EUKA